MKNNSVLMYVKWVFLLFVIIIDGCFAFFYIQMGVNNKEEYNVRYKSNSNIDYKVYLFKNDYFDEPFLEMNRTYISSLIKYVDVTFNYNLKFSELVKGSYTYYIKGTILADKQKSGGMDSAYWSKSYILKEPETVEYNGVGDVIFTSNVKIDYPKYNKILTEFKSDYGLLIDGSFKVELVVKSTSNSEVIGKEIPVESVMELKIPLTQQTVDLTIDLANNNNEGTVVETVEIDDFVYKLFIIIGVVIGLVDVFLIYLLFKGIRVIYLSQSEYSKTIKKILNTYDSIIVNVKSLPKFNDLKIVNVNNFSELIDAHSEVRMPVNYIEDVPNYKSRFVLVSDRMVWMYTLINKEYENYVGNGLKKKR